MPQKFPFSLKNRGCFGVNENMLGLIMKFVVGERKKLDFPRHIQVSTYQWIWVSNLNFLTARINNSIIEHDTL